MDKGARMALDTGYVSDLALGEPGVSLGVHPFVQSAPKTVGERLRSAREARGLSLTELEERTKVHRSHLLAIEEMRIEALPSRPFAIGYVRAYAEALGLDPDALVVRFRTESPEPDAKLRAPMGLAMEKRGQMGMIAAGVGAVAAAVLLWNLVQRVMTVEAPAPVAVAEVDAVQKLADLPPPRGVISIGTATPPPDDQTVPKPYVTPGLEAAYAAANGIILTANGAEPMPTGPAEMTPTLAAFAPKGAVYGAEGERAIVILQARKPANIVVRDGAGTIFFARQLAPGEAYRAPSTPGLLADVSDPLAFELYRDGQLQGPLSEPSVSLDKLARVAAR
jgi:transcriptional regulator with XRE-family HTH domain